MLVAEVKASVLSFSSSSVDVLSPKPVPRTSASSWTSGLGLFLRASERCFPTAPASLNESKKPRSAGETSSADPGPPFCSVSHSCSVKSALLAMGDLLYGFVEAEVTAEGAFVVQHHRAVPPALVVRG